MSLYSLKEVREKLGVSSSDVARLVKDNKTPLLYDVDIPITLGGGKLDGRQTGTTLLPHDRVDALIKAKKIETRNNPYLHNATREWLNEKSLFVMQHDFFKLTGQPTYEQLQAQIEDLNQQLAKVQAENEKLKENPTNADIANMQKAIHLFASKRESDNEISTYLGIPTNGAVHKVIKRMRQIGEKLMTDK